MLQTTMRTLTFAWLAATFAGCLAVEAEPCLTRDHLPVEETDPWPDRTRRYSKMGTAETLVEFLPGPESLGRPSLIGGDVPIYQLAEGLAHVSRASVFLDPRYADFTISCASLEVVTEKALTDAFRNSGIDVEACVCDPADSLRLRVSRDALIKPVENPPWCFGPEPSS